MTTKPCPVCGALMAFKKCEACQGDGTQWWHQEYLEPIAPERRLPCDVCRGAGGFWHCPNESIKPPEWVTRTLRDAGIVDE